MSRLQAVRPRRALVRLHLLLRELPKLLQTRLRRHQQRGLCRAAAFFAQPELRGEL